LLGGLLVTTIIVVASIAHTATPAGQTETDFLRTPRALPELQLTNARTGDGFGNQQFAGRWTLIYAGYLNCPDLCPTTMSLFARLNQQLSPHFAARGMRPPQFALLGIDQFRDTAANLSGYTDAFDIAIIPLTGTLEALTVATQALGFIPPPRQASAEVAHSSAIALIGPNAKLCALFRHPHTTTHIASALQESAYEDDC